MSDVDASATIVTGLTVRDYMAAQIITGVMASNAGWTRDLFEDTDSLAEYAYDVADAMLRIRSKR